MPKGFDWRRFWCPRDRFFDLSDRGFLADPDGRLGKYSNPDLVTFERLAELPCAVLLGEPGIGKSWTLQQESAKLQNSLPPGAKLLSLDLRSYSTDTRLMAALFESELFASWRKGDWLLHVFLDSLDECLLRIDNVATLLADELPKQPVERLRFRIACRTAPWPAVLENALVDLFGECNPYELVPLRRIDVQRAAEQSGIGDPNAFLERIDELDVSSLAIKPVTLKFLISTYAKDGDLPKDHLDLYEKGCRILAEEPSESRQGAARRGRLNSDERLAVASRIAAVTQLCKRFAVYTGREADGVPPEDVLITDLSGGVEHAADEMKVTAEALWEVLDTGLFSSRGANRFGWAHLTYAEFLAARYCNRRKMPIEQIRPLIFHPSDQGRRLIPQLHEVAAWMSAMDPEILEAVATSDPEALLGAAAASMSDDQRRLVVGSLLQQATEGRTLHLRWDLFWLYRKLNHPRLPDQLRPCLRDPKEPISARHVAISVARACQVEEVGPELADLALDLSADAGLRNSAAGAAAALASREVRTRLRPLALGEAGEDPDDELKGSGLRAIWPESITASELFSLLTPPKEQGLSGTYSRFLYDDAIQKLAARDLPVALEWLAKQGDRRNLIGPIDRVMDRIVEFAWENLNEPGVASGLATAIVSRLRLYDSILSNDDDREFATKVQQDQERRRTLLTALFPQLSVNGVTALTMSRVPLVAFADVEWLIDRALSGEANETALIEAKVVRFATHSESGQKVLAKLWHACQTNETLNEECGGWFAPIELDSELARSLREELRQRNEWKTPKLVTPSPSERIESDLQRIEAGNVAYGPQLIIDLTLEPTSSRYEFDTTADLTNTPGWKAADSPTRKRILDAAVRYLRDGDPQNDQWFRTRTIPFPAIAGFRALALLMITEDTRLESLSLDTLAKWVPIMLRSHPGAKDELQLQSRLLQRAHQMVSAELVKRILELIDAEDERDGHIFVANEVDICWDETLGAALLEKSRSSALKPQILGSILEILLKHEFPRAREFAETLIETKASGSELEQRQAVTAAQLLLRCTPDASWAKVWPLIRDGKPIGRSIIESASYGQAGIPNFVSKLNEAELGELYLWMVETYPYTERKRGFGFIGPSDSAVMVRDGILGHLKSRGTFAAANAIRSVMAKLPQYSWMRLYVDEAEALARANTWRPVSITEFLALAQDQDKRFVDSGSQLIETVLESLGRLHVTLHGELPAVRDLWNTPSGEFSPKDEQEVADYVARHLRQDLAGRGIIINREVQIRRGIGNRTGQLTDIHIDTVMPNERDRDSERIYAIVEVKGNWNAELLTAMQSQLRDRYLKENGSWNGLYLIAWFACPKWCVDDPRKKQCSSLPLSDARAFFSKQATELSKDGTCIRSYVLDASLS
jgi:predicted NACHT family NTPase